MKKIIPIIMCLVFTGCSNNVNIESNDEIDNQSKLANEQLVETEEETDLSTLEYSALRPMVMVGGRLYYDTGIEIPFLRCGTLDGEITSNVHNSEIPTEDNQSNFGEGYGYQCTGENTIDVFIENKWIRFDTEEYSEYEKLAQLKLYEFFDLYSEQAYDEMKELATGDVASSDFTYSIYGMSEANLIWADYCKQESNKDRLVFSCNFEMKPAEFSSSYEPDQTFASFYIIFEKVDDNYLISEFVKEL